MSLLHCSLRKQSTATATVGKHHQKRFGKIGTNANVQDLGVHGVFALNHVMRELELHSNFSIGLTQGQVCFVVLVRRLHSRATPHVFTS